MSELPTLSPDLSVHLEGAPEKPALTLTILCHPEADRIGEMVSMPLRGDDPVAISRTEPEFQAARGAPLGLDDPYVSRSPLHILPMRDGGLRIRPAREGLLYVVDGVEGTGDDRVTAEQFARGVTIGLANRVLLYLEKGERGRVPVERLGLWGTSRAMEKLRDDIDRVGPTDRPVLIRGATGTGKELVARALHRRSDRASKPFIAVNLAAVPAPTAVSQLFGHARGSFTGAQGAHEGYFGEAEGGTLFLDEIGEALTEIQPLLLRALDQREVQPVGGKTRTVDLRLVTATDADLDAAVEDGRFRAALLYRVSDAVLRIPPLRERPADIAVQFVHFLREALTKLDALDRLDHPEWLRPRIMYAVLTQPWLGNSRELRAAASRFAQHNAGLSRAELTPELQTEDRPTPVSPEREATPASELTLDEIREALKMHDYRVEATAAWLAISKNTLYARMVEAGIPRAKDLDTDMIIVARERAGRDLAKTAEILQVSRSGLRLRMRELGIE